MSTENSQKVGLPQELNFSVKLYRNKINNIVDRKGGIGGGKKGNHDVRRGGTGRHEEKERQALYHKNELGKSMSSCIALTALYDTS